MTERHITIPEHVSTLWARRPSPVMPVDPSENRLDDEEWTDALARLQGPEMYQLAYLKTLFDLECALKALAGVREIMRTAGLEAPALPADLVHRCLQTALERGHD